MKSDGKRFLFTLHGFHQSLCFDSVQSRQVRIVPLRVDARSPQNYPARFRSVPDRWTETGKTTTVQRRVRLLQQLRCATRAGWGTQSALLLLLQGIASPATSHHTRGPGSGIRAARPGM